MMQRRSLLDLLGVLIILAACGRVHGDSITLRSGATVAADAPITLGDVAMMVGDSALAHAGVVIHDQASDPALGKVWVEVTLQDVRDAMRDAGVTPGPIAMSGSKCTVRLVGLQAIEAGVAENPRREREPETVETDGPPTVRLRIAQTLAKLYGVEVSDLRLLFDEHAAEFLDQLEHRRRISVMTGTSASGGTRSVLVRVFAGESLVESRSVGVTIMVRREVVVAERDIARRTGVASEAVGVKMMWVDGGGAALVTRAEDAVGTLARTDIKAGEMLRANMLEPAVLVKRGSLVRVYCMSGGIAMELQARARASGKKGDVIEVRREGSVRSFMARVTDENTVVVDLDGAGLAGE